MKISKFLLPIIVCISCIFNIYADDYKYTPLVREGVEWHYLHTIHTYTGDTYTDLYFRFDGTETVNGTRYAVLYRYTDKEFDKSKALVAAYMREDGEKVYSITLLDHNGMTDELADKAEQLAYDFATPTTSDRFKHFDDATMSYKYVTIDGVTHKVVYMDNMVWAIDGIGMATDTEWYGYLPKPEVVRAASEIDRFILLLDVKEIETGKYLYRYDDFFGSVESTAISSNQLSVSISGGQLTVSGVDNCSSITIRDTSGRTVSSARANTINVSGLEKGMYIVSATSTSGKTQSKVVAIH